MRVKMVEEVVPHARNATMVRERRSSLTPEVGESPHVTDLVDAPAEALAEAMAGRRGAAAAAAG